MKGTWRVVTGLLAFWLLVLLYMSATLYNSGDVNEQTERQLARALQELDMLKQQNDELQRLATELRDIHVLLERQVPGSDLQEKLREANNKLQRLTGLEGKAQVGEAVLGPAPGRDGCSNEPTLEHELLRRKVEKGSKEFWNLVHSELTALVAAAKTGPTSLNTRVDHLLSMGADQHRTLLHDLYNLSLAGGAGTWRQREAQQLSDLVQRRIYYLQNPDDCSTAKKLVCNMNKGCGYGCQIHHVAYCFLVAYGTGRTLVLDSRGWRYSPQGWEKYFQPLSQTCRDRSGTSTRNWGPPDSMADVQVVDLPIVDSLHPRPDVLPQAIPADLADRMVRFHGHPFVWWIGQFLKYMLRPSPGLADSMTEYEAKLGFVRPIVGVHVRRTDKLGTEAAFHSIEEYMEHVAEWYRLRARHQVVKQKNVYLATDDPNLLEEAKKKFPDYRFLSDNAFSKSAGLSSRYSEGALRAVILDIHFLSLTDYLVCTFSSQVCRLAYELMQQYHSDASTFFKSLDDIYYFGGQHGHDQVALESHDPAGRREEIELAAGDQVGIAGNHWNGYSKGNNKRTSKTGLYPSYKVAEHVRVAEFPRYEGAQYLNISKFASPTSGKR